MKLANSNCYDVKKLEKDNLIGAEHVNFIISLQKHVLLFFSHCVNLLTAAGSIVVKVVNN